MTPTQIVAQVLKRLYPQNPDIVLGREARVIIDSLQAEGFVIVVGCLHVDDHECARCRTLRPLRPWLSDAPVDPEGAWTHLPHAGADCPYVRAGNCPFHRDAVFLADALQAST